MQGTSSPAREHVTNKGSPHDPNLHATSRRSACYGRIERTYCRQKQAGVLAPKRGYAAACRSLRAASSLSPPSAFPQTTEYHVVFVHAFAQDLPLWLKPTMGAQDGGLSGAACSMLRRHLPLVASVAVPAAKAVLKRPKRRCHTRTRKHEGSANESSSQLTMRAQKHLALETAHWQNSSLESPPAAWHPSGRYTVKQARDQASHA